MTRRAVRDGVGPERRPHRPAPDRTTGPRSPAATRPILESWPSTSSPIAVWRCPLSSRPSSREAAARSGPGCRTERSIAHRPMPPHPFIRGRSVPRPRRRCPSHRPRPLSLSLATLRLRSGRRDRTSGHHSAEERPSGRGRLRRSSLGRRPFRQSGVEITSGYRRWASIARSSCSPALGSGLRTTISTAGVAPAGTTST